MTAVQSEYSLWTRDPEPEVLPACAAFGIGFVPFGPLGKGFLTGTVDASPSFSDGDVRTTIPRFTVEYPRGEPGSRGPCRGSRPGEGRHTGQVALAWLLAQHPSIVPIPGTRRLSRVDDDTGATQLPLSADELADLNKLAGRIGVQGDHYNEHHMSLVDK